MGRNLVEYRSESSWVFTYGSMTYVLLWEHLTLEFKMDHALNMEGHNFEKRRL